MVVRELVALLGVKTDKKGMGEAESGMEKLVGYAKAAVAAFAALKIGQWAKAIINEVAKVGDRFDKLSKRTGLTTQKLQELEHAAELSGASLGDIETSLRRLQASQVDASEGLATYTREFDRLGVQIKNEDGTFKDTTQLLVEMADGMKNLSSDAERTQVATKLLGRSGTKLIPMFKEGSAAMRDMMGEVQALGGALDKDLIASSAEYIDNQRRMVLVTRGLKTLLGKAFLPIINKLYKAFFEWYKVNREWIFLKVGPILKGVAQVGGSVFKAITSIVKIFTNWIGKLTPLEKGIGKIGLAIIGISALLMMGPIGQLLILAGLIALIIDDFMTWREGGKSVIGDLVNSLSQLLGVDVEAWLEKGIELFSRAGEMAKAVFQTMFETVFAFVQFLIDVWDDPEKAWTEFIDRVKWIWMDFFEFVQEHFGDLITWFDEEVIAPILDGFLGLWDGITSGLSSTFDKVKSWIKDLKKLITDPFKKIGKVIAEAFGSEPKVDAEVQTGSPEIKGIKTLLSPEGRSNAFGGGAMRMAPASNQSIVNAPQTEVQVSVTGTQGMNEKQLASEVAKQVSTAIENQNRAALQALTPAKSSGVL